MKYNQLSIESKKTSKRVGRGIASGKGKTAGRGTKGQKARAGSSRRPGFSGGQNVLMQQWPKLPGFKSKIPKAENVYTNQLDELKKKTVDNYLLFESGLISSPHVRVKLLFSGEIKSAVNVKLQSASAQAINALQKAGGSFEKTSILKREAKKEAKEIK